MLDKIRTMKDVPMMVCFTLVTIRKPYNCIVVDPELATVLLMLQDEKYNISVEGRFNQKKQIIVSSFIIRNPAKITRELGF